eukprot:scaffold202582_cov46-Attheya_sp.AAC.3
MQGAVHLGGAKAMFIKFEVGTLNDVLEAGLTHMGTILAIIIGRKDAGIGKSPTRVPQPSSWKRRPTTQYIFCLLFLCLPLFFLVFYVCLFGFYATNQSLLIFLCHNFHETFFLIFGQEGRFEMPRGLHSFQVPDWDLIFRTIRAYSRVGSGRRKGCHGCYGDSQCQCKLQAGLFCVTTAVTIINYIYDRRLVNARSTCQRK